VVICIKTLKLQKYQDIVGLNHSLQSQSKLRLIANHVIQDRDKRSIQGKQLTDYISVTGQIEKLKPFVLCNVLI
jgi:hypothetical protein